MVTVKGRGSKQEGRGQQAPQGAAAEETDTGTREEKRGFRSGRATGEVPEFAKFGSDLLKRTVVSGLGVIKEVTDGLPKDAGGLLSKGKEEVLKTLLSKDVLHFLTTSAIETAFSKIRDYRLEVSIRIREVGPERNPVEQGSAKKRTQSTTESE